MVLLICALICVFLRSIGVPLGRVDLGWLGMTFFIASFLIR